MGRGRKGVILQGFKNKKDYESIPMTDGNFLGLGFGQKKKSREIKPLFICQKRFWMNWDSWSHATLPIFLSTRRSTNMQIQPCLHRREEYFIFKLWLFCHRLIFFCLFHSLYHIICDISEIFLPRRSIKLGENVPNRVKRDKHLVFKTKIFIQTAHAFTTSQKKNTICLRKPGRCNVNNLYRPMGTQANARRGALEGGEWPPLIPKKALEGVCPGVNNALAR